MVSTSVASIIATPNPATVIPTNVSSGGTLLAPETVTIEFELENPTSSALTVTTIGPFSISVGVTGSSPSPTIVSPPTTLITSGTAVGEWQPAPAGNFSLSAIADLTTGSRNYVDQSGTSINGNGSEPFATLDITLPIGWIVGDSVTLAFNEPRVFNFGGAGTQGELTDLFDLQDGVAPFASNVNILTAVPEPNSFLMLGLVSVGMVGVRRWRRLDLSM